jgi:hypothetical protein
MLHRAAMVKRIAMEHRAVELRERVDYLKRRALLQRADDPRRGCG